MHVCFLYQIADYAQNCMEKVQMRNILMRKRVGQMISKEKLINDILQSGQDKQNLSDANYNFILTLHVSSSENIIGITEIHGV